MFSEHRWKNSSPQGFLTLLRRVVCLPGTRWIISFHCWAFFVRSNGHHPSGKFRILPQKYSRSSSRERITEISTRQSSCSHQRNKEKRKKRKKNEKTLFKSSLGTVYRISISSHDFPGLGESFLHNRISKVFLFVYSSPGEGRIACATIERDIRAYECLASRLRLLRRKQLVKKAGKPRHQRQEGREEQGRWKTSFQISSTDSENRFVENRVLFPATKSRGRDRFSIQSSAENAMCKPW